MTDVEVSPITTVDPPGLQLLHDREYRVRAFLQEPTEPGGARRVLLRGAIRDQKPAGLHVADDPDPLTIHHMQVDLVVRFPDLVIEQVDVRFIDHPEVLCTDIIERYQGIVGLSIARGFTHRVREVLGGPRGCTHTTALLLAMAPVAVQCYWSIAALDHGPDYEFSPEGQAAMTPEAIEEVLRPNLNTCHVWEDGSDHVSEARASRAMTLPLTIKRRLAEQAAQAGGD